MWIFNHSMFRLLDDEFYDIIAHSIKSDPNLQKIIEENDEDKVVESMGYYQVYQQLKRKTKLRTSVFNISYCTRSSISEVHYVVP